MVVAGVDEVVGTETDEEKAPAVVMPSRFERIKESYKGVTSALDLSEESAAYDDFDALLGEQKVRPRQAGPVLSVVRPHRAL